MCKHKTIGALSAASLLLLILAISVHAQVVDGGWSEPYQLSSSAGKASEGYSVADRFGFVHVFWTEILFSNERTVLRYARFDGETWSYPNDIYVTGARIKNVSPFVDQQGTLHIAWAEGLVGPAFYMQAPVNKALSVHNWTQPIRIDFPARTILLRVDSKGVYHILYINQIEAPGVYYTRSEDRGITWSKPAWLDPDILPNHIPDSLNFEVDENDGLHAAWFYGALNDTSTPDWVRYAHSLDGGNNWSAPFLIDQYVNERNHKLTSASPRMIVQGNTVHLIWAAGSLPFRYHRYSSDAGQTWSKPGQIFGKLHGQAFDGLAIDRANRVHFVGQIRYPQGIYTAYWDQTRWSSPSLIYLIVPDNSPEGLGERIHAHFTQPVVRAGNQLVLTFTDGPADPERRLFAMHHTLNDIPPLESVPTPAAIPSSTPLHPAANPTISATELSIDLSIVHSSGQVSSPDTSLWLALIPTLFLLGVTLVIQLFTKYKN